MEPLLYSEPSKLSNSNSFVFLTPRRKIKLFRVCDQLQAALNDTQKKICYQVSQPITSPLLNTMQLYIKNTLEKYRFVTKTIFMASNMWSRWA